MEFKVGDRVGLDAYLDYGYYPKHNKKLSKGISVDNLYDLKHIDKYLLFGTISFINNEQALVVWDNSDSDDSDLIKFVTDRLISFEFLVPEEELKNKFQKLKNKTQVAQNELTILFKQLKSTFDKIQKVDTGNFELKEFDGSSCLRDFIDAAGWSSSSLSC